MANILDWQNNKNLGPYQPTALDNLLGNVFSSYNPNSSPLTQALTPQNTPQNTPIDKFISEFNSGQSPENMITPEKAAILSNAIANFNSNRRSPGMAEAAIPGVEPTEIPKLDPLKFGMPVGMGSWQNIPEGKLKAWYNAKNESASMGALTDKQAKEEIEKAKEQSAIKRYVLNTPELKGRSPDEFTTLKQAQDEAKRISSKKPEKPVSLFQLKKDEEEFKKIRAQRLKAEADAKIALGLDPYSTTNPFDESGIGGVAAPVGGKTIMYKGGQPFSVPSENVDKLKLRGYTLK